MDKYSQIQKDRRDAEAILKNDFWPKIWERMHKQIDRLENNCNVAKEPETAQDIIRTRQLLKEIEQIAKRAVNRGEVEEKVMIKQLEQNKLKQALRAFKR